MIRQFVNSALLTGMIFYASSSFAYRPLATEDAGVAGKGAAQLEMSWDHSEWWNNDQENSFLFVPIYGLTRRIELSCEIPYMIHHPKEGESHDGFGDVNLVGKFLLFEETAVRPSTVLKGVLKTSSGDKEEGLGSGTTDYSVVAAFSKNFSLLAIHAMLGFTDTEKTTDQDTRDIYLYGIALDYGLTEKWHLVTEFSGNRHPDRQSDDDPKGILLGVTYKVNENVTWDGAVRWGLNDSVPDWNITTGVSLTF